MRRIATALLLIVLGLLWASASASAGVPRYLGPPVASPGDAPFTAWIGAETSTGASFCTGSILDATHVLTAAHCTRDASGNPLPTSAYQVLVGLSRLDSPVAGTQGRSVSAVRVHPAYAPETSGPLGDVAILQLSRPLILGATVAPIVPVAVGGGAAPGTAVRGFGTGAIDAAGNFDDVEHSLDMTVVGGDTCVASIASLACARSDAGGSCHGDSGGPVVVAATGALAGVLDLGIGGSCVAGSTTGYTDVSVPGIALWLQGNDNPPAMPFTAQPAMVTAPPLTGGAITCGSPAWTNAATTIYAFVRTDGGAVLQQGASPTYVPTAADVGHSVTCRSVAVSPGGTATAPALTNLSIVAAQLALRPGARTVALSYGGPSDLHLHLTLTDGHRHQVWKRSTGSERSIRLPAVAPGLYQLCVSAPAAGQFASATVCRKWRAIGSPSRAVHRPRSITRSARPAPR